jgi:hypothetical protein
MYNPSGKFIEISIEFLHRKLAYREYRKFSMELHRNSSYKSMELHRNTMELHMPIFCRKILWRFLWNFPDSKEIVFVYTFPNIKAKKMSEIWEERLIYSFYVDK